MVRSYTGQRIADIAKPSRGRGLPIGEVDIPQVPPDTGCDVSPSCLECPLNQCLYDYKPRERAIVKANFLYQRKMAILEQVIRRIMEGESQKKRRKRRN
jgi:hypothetical protein